jgi:hypothetical protein
MTHTTSRRPVKEELEQELEQELEDAKWILEYERKLMKLQEDIAKKID